MKYLMPAPKKPRKPSKPKEFFVKKRLLLMINSSDTIRINEMKAYMKRSGKKTIDMSIVNNKNSNVKSVVFSDVSIIKNKRFVEQTQKYAARLQKYDADMKQWKRDYNDWTNECMLHYMMQLEAKNETLKAIEQYSYLLDAI